MATELVPKEIVDAELPLLLTQDQIRDRVVPSIPPAQRRINRAEIVAILRDPDTGRGGGAKVRYWYTRDDGLLGGPQEIETTLGYIWQLLASRDYDLIIAEGAKAMKAATDARGALPADEQGENWSARWITANVGAEYAGLFTSPIEQAYSRLVNPVVERPALVEIIPANSEDRDRGAAFRAALSRDDDAVIGRMLRGESV